MTATRPYNPDPIEARRAGVRANGTTDDSAALQAAINAAQTQGRALALPHGNIKLNTGVTITKAGFWMYGQGIGQTTLKPQGNIVGLTISPASTLMAVATVVENFSMDGGTYIAQTNTGIQIPLGRPSIVVRNIYLTQFDCCFDTTGQFCLFERIGCYFSNLGFFAHQALGINGGGGNNNVWTNVVAQGNNVGFLGVNDSDFGYPCHANQFSSSAFHDNTTCGMYLNGVKEFQLGTAAHENNGLSGPATRVVKGYTIKKSTWHLSGAKITATAFQCTTGSPDPNYILELASRLTFLDSSGTAMYTQCDPSSKIYFEGHHDLYGRVTNVVKWPAAQASLNPVLLVGEPARIPSAMPNTCPFPRSLNVFGSYTHTNATVGTDADPDFGNISYVQFAASASPDGGGTNRGAWDTKTGTYTGTGNTIACSFLVRSSVATQLGLFGWGGLLAGTHMDTIGFPVLAGKVYRVTLVGTTSATPTTQAMGIFPLDAAGAKVNVWDCHAIYSNPTAPDYPHHAPIISAFVEQGWFNPVTALPTYAATNVTTDRTYDADTVAVAELADVVGTLIADLRARGVVL